MACRYSQSKRKAKFLENCRRKVPHDTWASAQAALESVREAGRLKEPERTEVYLCAVCGHYHWGKRGIIARKSASGHFRTLLVNLNRT